jgi:hypothetical protein
MSPAEFTSVAFFSLDLAGQIAKCRELAQHAADLAANGHEQLRAHHAVLRERWSALADRLPSVGRAFPN